MINLFDNIQSIDCARRMKKMGFFGDYIIATRSMPLNMFIMSKALSLGWLKSSIARIKNLEETPQGYYFWMRILRQL